MEFNKLNLIALNLGLLLPSFLICLRLSYKKIIFIQMVIFSIFYGLRDEGVGIDTLNYIIEYNTGLGGYFEFGFKKIGYILYALNFSESYYFLTITFIQALFIYLLIKKISIKDSLKPILMWLFLSNTTVVFNSINGLRQGISATLLLYLSIKFINKSKKSEIFKIFAYIMHKSSVIFIFLKIWEIMRKKFFFNFKRTQFLLISIFLMGAIFQKIILKFGIIPFDYINAGSKLLMLKIILSLNILAIYFYLEKMEKNKNKLQEIKVYINSYSFILSLVLFFYQINEVANRFLYYAGYYSPLLIIYFIDCFSKNKLLKIVIVVILNLSYYIILINTRQYAIMFNY